MRWTNSLALLLAVTLPCWGQRNAPAQTTAAAPTTKAAAPAAKAVKTAHPAAKTTPFLAPPPQSAPAFTVALDAAHGGTDSGAKITDKLQEKTVTLTLSVRLRSALAARGISVVTTREQDTSLSQQVRAETANHAQAAACLLLHASNSGVGVHLFVSPIAPTLPAKITPWNSVQGAFVEKSLKLAGVLNGAFTQASVPVTLARAAVLPIDHLACPAVAVEVSPLPPANGNPVRGLEDAGYQSQIAEAVVAAILEWRNGEK